MAIKIELQSTIIPIEIGAFKFEVDMTDEKEKAFKGKLDDFLKEAGELDEEKPEDEIKLKEMLTEVYDDLLGEGSFEKLYKEHQEKSRARSESKISRRIIRTNGGNCGIPHSNALAS